MEDNYQEVLSACALGRIFGYEPQISHSLIDNLGTAEAVFTLSSKELDTLFGPYSKYRSKINRGALDESESELERLSRTDATFIPYFHPNFPDALRECEDAPVGLYVRTHTPLEEVFNSRPCVGIVGTRDMSPYGKEWTVRTVEALSKAPVKPTVVSGLAYGIDITAHMAALGFGAPTIAVLPTGIDEVYPKQHITAAEKIVNTPGCALVTDYPPGTSPLAITFLRRNRIIAGLSESTLLMESKTKGGGMITARMAFGYGRRVFALPGRVDDVRSQGCNSLLREMVAEPLSSPESLPADIGLGSYSRRKKADLLAEARKYYACQGQKGGGVTPGTLKQLLKVLDMVKRNRGIDLEELARVTGFPYPDVLAFATTLESDGFLSIDLLQRCSIAAKKL